MTTILLASYGVCLLLLLLVVLTLMREIVIQRGEVAALSQLITTPPAPRMIDRPLPETLRAEITKSADAVSDLHVIMFLSNSCGPCQQLVDDLHVNVRDGVISPHSTTCVIADSAGGSGLAQSMTSCGVAVIEDGGDTAAACDIRGTPLLVAVDRRTMQSTDYSYGGGIAWILRQLEAAPDHDAAAMDMLTSSEQASLNTAVGN